MWVRSLGRALLGGFGSGSVMCFIQMMTGAGIAGSWLGIPPSLQVSAWADSGQFMAANMTGSAHQQGLPNE